MLVSRRVSVQFANLAPKARHSLQFPVCVCVGCKDGDLVSRSRVSLPRWGWSTASLGLENKQGLKRLVWIYVSYDFHFESMYIIRASIDLYKVEILEKLGSDYLTRPVIVPVPMQNILIVSIFSACRLCQIHLGALICSTVTNTNTTSMLDIGIRRGVSLWTDLHNSEEEPVNSPTHPPNPRATCAYTRKWDSRKKKPRHVGGEQRAK